MGASRPHVRHTVTMEAQAEKPKHTDTESDHTKPLGTRFLISSHWRAIGVNVRSSLRDPAASLKAVKKMLTYSRHQQWQWPGTVSHFSHGEVLMLFWAQLHTPSKSALYM